MKTIQTTGLNRSKLDKYYTAKTTVDICFELIEKYIKITNDDICIEPSAGNGAFVEHIKRLFQNYKFYDIEPEHSEVIKQNYLSLNISDFVLFSQKKIHLIGNPPFGRQSSTAIKFIKKSAQFCDSISFILPKSFKKDSLKKHFPLEFHLVCEIDLPYNSFLVDGKEYDVPCVFQIWIKKKEKRPKTEKLFPDKFSFVNKDAHPDISFRRVGIHAGKIENRVDDKSVQSHYFIKFNTEINEDKYEKLGKINFACRNHTSGPRSISKQELIKEFNNIL